MPPSEAQKRARDDWDRKNMKTIGCKLKKEDADAFKQYAASKGQTANTLLKAYILDCLGKDS